MARHTQLTPDLKDAIVAAVREGASLPAAAQAHDVLPTTAGYWLRLGQGPHARRLSMQVYAAFATEVLDALASSGMRHVQEMPDAGAPLDAELTALLASLDAELATLLARFAAQKDAELAALLAPFADREADAERLRAGFEALRSHDPMP